MSKGGRQEEEELFAEAFDRREAERIMSGLDVLVSRHLGAPERERVKALIARTRTDLDRAEARRMAGLDDTFRAKRRDETDAQWRARVAQADMERVHRFGEIVPDEARQHAEMDEVVVTHIETFTAARTVRVRTTTSLDRMLENGSLSNDQLDAAEQIMAAIELIERDVAMRGARFDARVDCSGSSGSALIEQIAIVRLQVVYSLWRKRLPVPKRMVIDMLTCSGSMKAAARKHRMDWPRAKVRLKKALDTWLEIRDKVWSEIDHDEIEQVHLRLGGGSIL